MPESANVGLGNVLSRVRTPIWSRIRADISQANRRLSLQQVDKGKETRAPDAPNRDNMRLYACRRNKVHVEAQRATSPSPWQKSSLCWGVDARRNKLISEQVNHRTGI